MIATIVNHGIIDVIPEFLFCYWSLSSRRLIILQDFLHYNRPTVFINMMKYVFHKVTLTTEYHYTKVIVQVKEVKEDEYVFTSKSSCLWSCFCFFWLQQIDKIQCSLLLSDIEVFMIKQ